MSVVAIFQQFAAVVLLFRRVVFSPACKLNPDDDLINLITPDVMKCLDYEEFFGQLDDLLCPKDRSRIREMCGGGFKLIRIPCWPDLKRLPCEPWLDTALFQRERNGALLGVQVEVRSKVS
jgi:hypothetical protein